MYRERLPAHSDGTTIFIMGFALSCFLPALVMARVTRDTGQQLGGIRKWAVRRPTPRVHGFLPPGVSSRVVAVYQPANAVAAERSMGDVLGVEQHGVSGEKYRVGQVQAIFPYVGAAPFSG